MKFNELIIVFLGGGLGSVCRFGLGKIVSANIHSTFPFATLLINFLACLLLGFIVGFFEQKIVQMPLVRLFVAVGFCGGFSTFSTFSHETFILFQNENYLRLIFYVFWSLILGFGAIYLGLFIGKNKY